MRARGRRLRIAIAGCGVALLALWIFSGGPGRPQLDDPQRGQEPRDGDATPGTRRDPAPTETEPPAGAPPVPDDAARAQPSGVPPADVPGAVPAIDPGVDPAASDRFEGMLHIAGEAMDDGRFGAAWRALDAARALDLSGARQARLESVTAGLEQRVDTAVAAVADLAGSGSVLAAAEQLTRLRDPPHPRVERALAAAVDARGWPGWPAGPAPDAAAVASPEPLARGRVVRLRFHDDWCTGRIVGAGEAPGAGPETVAVEVATPAGQAYPFVLRNALEPVEPTSSEAVAQAEVAWRAGDAALAALWLARSYALGSSEAPRVRALAGRLARAAESARESQR